MKTILLKMAGPLQSWGTSSHFYSERHTDFHPSKSAIIGMIAASLGYKRSEKDKYQKLNELDFAVREDQTGNVLKDYQIGIPVKKDGSLNRKKTYVMHKYYLEDAVFIVAIGSENDEWIEQIAYALKHPYYQLYMGRKSCPLPADSFIDTKATDVITALSTLPWQAADWYKAKYIGEKTLYVYADKNLLGEACATTWRQDKVISFDSWEEGGRKFEMREEGMMKIKVEENTEYQTLHDAFAALEV